MLYFWYIAFNFPTNKPVVVSRSNRLNTRRLSRLLTFKILLVQIGIVFLSFKTEMDLQQILHDVPGEFFPEGRPPFLRKAVQRPRLQVNSSLTVKYIRTRSVLFFIKISFCLCIKFIKCNTFIVKGHSI